MTGIWKEKKLENIVESNIIGLTRSIKEQAENNNYKYVKMNNIANDNSFKFSKYVCVNASDIEVGKFKLQNGDFLFNTRNSFELVGKSCVYSYDNDETVLFNNNIMRIRFIEGIDSNFIAYAFNTPHIIGQLDRYKRGTTNVSAIYYKSFKNLSIPLPPIPEQKRIVKILDEAFAAIDKAKANAEKNLQNSRELFDSYLNKVFAYPGEDWEIKKLTDIANVSTGKWNANHAIDNGEFRFYTCAYDYLYCDTKRFSGECLILPGNGVNVGEVFYYNGAFDAYQRTYVLNDIKILPKYLHYHMMLFWKELGTKKQYGSATNFIKIGNFQEYDVAVPPLSEQKRIVSKIDVLSTGKKQLEKIYQQKLVDLEELKKSILKKAFEGELTIDNG